MNKKRLLIIGCGDIARRVVRLLRGRYRVYGLLRDPALADTLREEGITPIGGDLDDASTLVRLAGIGQEVLHAAPPPLAGRQDSRTAALLHALSGARMLPRRFVYISTSGVYGDCEGALVDETWSPSPGSDRAARRASAEQQLRRWCARHQVSLTILRAPGIYALDRLPLQRLTAATPAIVADEDSYSNHIHADDLARVCLLALHRGDWGRGYNVADDSALKMGDYFDLVADRFRLPRPPRISREEAERQLPANLLSFINESRRLTNRRLLREFRLRLRYPTVAAALAENAR